MQDANHNATQTGLGAQADAVDPGSGEETAALMTEQEQTVGGGGVSNQPGEEEGPSEREQAGEGCGEGSPVLATEQEQANADGVESSQPSEEDSQSATAPSES